MSCNACVGCDEPSLAVASSGAAALDRMIASALTDLHVALSDAEQTKWELHFNAIGFALAERQITAIKPLVAVFEQRGTRAFLRVAAHCNAINMRGLLLAWAWMHCDERVDAFIAAVCGDVEASAESGADTRSTSSGAVVGTGVDGDKGSGKLIDRAALIAHVNREASFHECFAGNAKQPRAMEPIPVPAAVTPEESVTSMGANAGSKSSSSGAIVGSSSSLSLAVLRRFERRAVLSSSSSSSSSVSLDGASKLKSDVVSSKSSSAASTTSSSTATIDGALPIVHDLTESHAQHDCADDTDDDETDDDHQPDRLVDEVRARIQAARARKRALHRQQQQQQQARGLGASFLSACSTFVSRVRADLSPRVLALLCCLVLVLAWRRLRVSL